MSIFTSRVTHVQQKSSFDRSRRKTSRVRPPERLRRRRRARLRINCRIRFRLRAWSRRFFYHGGVRFFLLTSRRCYSCFFLFAGREQSGAGKNADVFFHIIIIDVIFSDLIKFRVRVKGIPWPPLDSSWLWSCRSKQLRPGLRPARPFQSFAHRPRAARRWPEYRYISS